MDTISVVIVDDHPTFRSGLRVVFEAAADVAVIGEGATAADAVAVIEAGRPRVALIDLDLPDGSGLDVIRRVGRDGVACLVLSMHSDEDSLHAAIEAGARGYLLKGADAAEILTAVRMVANGGAAFGAGMAERMLGARSRPAPAAPFPELTERERAVLTELATGRSNATIAARTGLAPKTVRNYVSTICVKLGAADRVDLILRARSAGIGSADRPT